MEITRHNFAEQIDNITKDLKRSCFIGFDAEFTAILSGESFKYRLFDTNEDRYDQIKTEVSKMIMTQVGLTMFRYERDHDTYVATGYTFHLCPQVFADIDQSFIFQASTLKFLCRHKFDFNKFTYEGLPYLSKAEETRVQQILKEDTCINTLIQSLEMEDERLLQNYCSEVSKWLTNSVEGTMYLDVQSPVLRYIVHNEIRLRFPDVLTTDSLGNSNKVLIYRDKYVEGANSAPLVILKENLMNKLHGFSQIISLLEAYQKPIIGHNIFMDIILLHNQFIGPMPKKYKTFKKNINKMFPNIFDTKYISHQMGKRLSFDEVWKSNALQDLYEFFSEGKCKKLESGVNLVRLSTPFDVKQSYHEAGWDSYCSGIKKMVKHVGSLVEPSQDNSSIVTGYCFIRLSHWQACENSGKYRPVGPTEKVAAMSSLANKVNVIRGAIPYMNLVGDDPPSHRPNLLHVKSLKERIINIGKVAAVLASCGNIDVKLNGGRTALIAANSHHTVNSILNQFRDSHEYRITRYSVYRHSVAGRVAMWSGALITGSLVLYFLHKKVK